MDDKIFYFSIPDIPDSTHYKYVTAYEGSVKNHIFRRAEHLLRMVANFKPEEIILVFRIFYDPRSIQHPQDRMKISLCAKFAEHISPDVVDQIVCQGPLAEFYRFGQDTDRIRDWSAFCAVTEIIRLEEALKPSSPPGLDIHKLNELIPDFYYCIHPFKPRKENDFLMYEEACSPLNEPALLEIMIQPVSQTNELDSHYREIVKLIAINSYNSDDYILNPEQLDPFKALYEPKASGEREIRTKDPIADEFLRNHREFHRVLRQPQLEFNIKVWATRPETARLLASTAAECAFEEGAYRLLDYDSNHEWFARSLKASKKLMLFSEACHQDIWGSYDVKSLFRLSHMTSVDEFKGMFRLPVAGYSSLCCLWKSTDYHRKIKSDQGLLIGHGFNARDKSKSETTPGPLSHYLDVSSPIEQPVITPVEHLVKHMFVTGVPGSGKTTAVFNILVQLFKHNVPFLVIEPGKSEYRQLKLLRDHPDPVVRKMAINLRVLTPGKDDVSPFYFNPLQHPEGVPTDEHIGQLLTCFEASMPLGGPLQALLAESVETVYREREKQASREKRQPDFPTMTDLVVTARQIMGKKGYSGEVRSNLSAAIEVRLSSLTRLSIGKIFRCQCTLPSVSELLKHPTIIEIQNLNSYQACLLILFLLSAIWEEIRIARSYSRGLKHVTVIEEAHNIVGRTEQARPSEEFADPKAYAAEYVVRMLAEIRAFGEGIIIADQLPSAVASSVIKNTGTKLAHRLVSRVDREDLGGAMLLQSPQMEEIARLEPGEAYYYTEGLYAPRQINGLNAYGFLGLGNRKPPDNSELLSVIKEQNWFWELKKGHYSYIVRLLADQHERFKESINKVAVHLEIYQDSLKRIKEISNTEKIQENLISLRADVICTRESLKASCSFFIDFVKSLPKDIVKIIGGADLEKYDELTKNSMLLMNGQVLNLDTSLENLRAEITCIL